MTAGKKGKLMVIGSGPIVIGQAAEFDFSGSQACRSLREEGYETVLVNSNPATIQTDLEMADIVYIEPLTVETIAKIIEKEKVEGVLSGMGGQTALNLCSELAEKGYLDRLNCRLYGTQPRAIALSEDRELFKETMIGIGEPVPRSKTCHTLEEAREAVKYIGKYPVLIRPAYTLGAACAAGNLGRTYALDAATGRMLWQGYTIPQAPAPVRKNAGGVQLWGPSGASIWSSQVAATTSRATGPASPGARPSERDRRTFKGSSGTIRPRSILLMVPCPCPRRTARSA